MQPPKHSHPVIWILLGLTMAALVWAIYASFVASPGLDRLFAFGHRVDAECAVQLKDGSPGADRQQTLEACEAVRKQLEAEKAEFRAAGYR